jgi:hypothetical protein
VHSLYKYINYFFLIFNFILKMSEINIIDLIESYISCRVAIFGKYVQVWFQGYVTRAHSSLIQPSPSKGDYFHVTTSFIKYLNFCYMVWKTFTQADNLAALTRTMFIFYPMAV